MSATKGKGPQCLTLAFQTLEDCLTPSRLERLLSVGSHSCAHHSNGLCQLCVRHFADIEHIHISYYLFLLKINILHNSNSFSVENTYSYTKDTVWQAGEHKGNTRYPPFFWRLRLYRKTIQCRMEAKWKKKECGWNWVRQNCKTSFFSLNIKDNARKRTLIKVEPILARAVSKEKAIILYLI